MAAPITLSRRAETRLRQPRLRGMFRPIDAARRGLGLLAVADGDGQAQITWLVDLATQRIEDARFLAFGSLASHPLADAFSEAARSRTVAEACRLAPAEIEAALRDEPTQPAIGPDPAALTAFITDLQTRALAALPAVRVLPKPDEKPVYQRKKESDWDAADRAWLPVKYLNKVAKVDAVFARVLGERLPGASHVIEGLHDDLRIAVRFEGLAADQAATIAQAVQDALRSQLHPLLIVEVVEAVGADDSARSAP